MMNNIGKRIRELREKAGLQQKELAEKLSMQRVSLNYYENGERLPKTAAVIALSEFFDVSTDYLLGRTDAPTPPPVHRDTDILYASTVTGLPLKLVEALASMKDDSSFSAGKITKNYILIDIGKRVLNDETDA